MDYSQRGQFFDSFLGNIFFSCSFGLGYKYVSVTADTLLIRNMCTQLKYVTFLLCTWYQTLKLNSTMLNIDFFFLEYGTYQGHWENIETCCKYIFDSSKLTKYYVMFLISNGSFHVNTFPCRVCFTASTTMYLNEDVIEVMYTFFRGL